MSKQNKETPYGWILGSDGQWIPAERSRMSSAEKWQWAAYVLAGVILLAFLILPVLWEG